ncbi:hypothetical protein ACLK1S_01220 [Escherichia coli]
MYATPSGSTLLIDRNCHKSLAHLLMMNDVVPVWLEPTRNALGILVGSRAVDLLATASKRKSLPPRTHDGGSCGDYQLHL